MVEMENKMQTHSREYYRKLAATWTPSSKPKIDDTWPIDIRNLAYDTFFETFRYQPKDRKIECKQNLEYDTFFETFRYQPTDRKIECKQNDTLQK